MSCGVSRRRERKTYEINQKSFRALLELSLLCANAKMFWEKKTKKEDIVIKSESTGQMRKKKAKTKQKKVETMNTTHNERWKYE